MAKSCHQPLALCLLLNVEGIRDNNITASGGNKPFLRKINMNQVILTLNVLDRKQPSLFLLQVISQE